MQPLDYAVVGAYLVGLFVIGIVVARRASSGSDEYFLAGRRLPWWALGASGMSSNLDAAGTITIIALIYTYGLQGFFIEMRGGVVLPIAVWLAFMGKWHRRSNVTTTAEWMELRFGRGTQGRAARYTAAMTYLVITVGMTTFFLVAAGIFLADFTPGVPSGVEIGAMQRQLADLAADDPQRATLAADLAALQGERQSAIVWLSVAMAVVALAYTMISGLHGVVWTDVFQAGLIGAAAIWISYQAYFLVTPELLASWPGAAHNVPWPELTFGTPDEPYHLFWLFAIFWAGKGILEGLGGSGGSAYMAQRYYAAASDVATRRLSMLWAVLFAFRWPMVLGLAIIGVSLGIGQENPERVLSGVLLDDGFFPAGVRGLAVAAIFAASMSTFDSTINAGASYVVKDLYVPLAAGRGSAVSPPGAADQPHPADPDRTAARVGEEAAVSQKAQVVVGYLASIVIVALGLGIALAIPTDSVVYVWTTIVVQLFPAFLVPFALRWFWWRFNGAGFCLGIAFGFVASLVVTLVPTGLNEWQTIGGVALVSLAGCLVGTFAAAGPERQMLADFYARIRPFGLWPREWKQGHEAEHRRDVVRLVGALLWQVMTFLLPMLLVLHQWGYFVGLLVPWAGLTLFLWIDAKGAPGDEAAE